MLAIVLTSLAFAATDGDDNSTREGYSPFACYIADPEWMAKGLPWYAQRGILAIIGHCSMWAAHMAVRLPFFIQRMCRKTEAGERIEPRGVLLVLSLIFAAACFLTAYLPKHTLMPYHCPPAQYVGIITGVLVAGIFLWVHLAMRDVWSPVITRHTDHRLITGGPFRFARHPMYSAMVLMVFCILLFTESWLAPLGWAVMAVYVVAYRVPREERLMRELFGGEYSRYATSVGAITPWPFPCEVGGCCAPEDAAGWPGSPPPLAAERVVLVQGV